NRRWDFAPGETATFHFEYRILAPVDNAAILFRLNLVHRGGGEIIFAEMREVLSSQPLEAGYLGVVEFSLKVPDLMPNRFLPYLWLGRTSNVGSYDIVDANVGLPDFVVRPSTEHDQGSGLVSLAYEARKSGTFRQDAMIRVD